MTLPGPIRTYGKEALFVLAFAGACLAWAALAEDGRTALDPLGCLLLVAGSVALPLRRRFPVAVLLVAAGCVLAYLVRGYRDGSPVLPLLVAVFTAVRAGYLRLTLLVVAAGVATSALILALGAEGESSRAMVERRVLAAGWLFAGAILAETTRQRAAYLEQVERRAEQAERTREETARRRAGEERLRIARELHDSLTHSISVIKVQAGVAVHLARKRDEKVPAALLAIQEASADATRELRATLHVLRDADTCSGLDRLGDLIERARAAGVRATVTVEGVRRPLPGEVDRAAYRIVQESLTNVARHAGGGASAAIRIGYGEGGLVLQVEDDGAAAGGGGTTAPPGGDGTTAPPGGDGTTAPPGGDGTTPAPPAAHDGPPPADDGPPPPGGDGNSPTPPAAHDEPPAPPPGIGLTGMRERVTALGGTLATGPRPGGGFRVRAELPLHRVPR